MDTREDKMKIRRIGRHIIPRIEDHIDNYSTMYNLMITPNVLMVVLIILGTYCYCYKLSKTTGRPQQQMFQVQHVPGISGFM